MPYPKMMITSDDVARNHVAIVLVTDASMMKTRLKHISTNVILVFNTKKPESKRDVRFNRFRFNTEYLFFISNIGEVSAFTFLWLDMRWLLLLRLIISRELRSSLFGRWETSAPVSRPLDIYSAMPFTWSDSSLLDSQQYVSNISI